MRKLKIFAFVSLLIGLSACNEFTTPNAKRKEARAWKTVPKILKRIVAPTFPDINYNVEDFGAVGDSIYNNKKAFQEAITKCSEQGGGTINVPVGQYFIDGPLHFKDNVHLHIKEGARLFFSSNPASYLPAVKVRWEGTVCYNYSPLIYGIGIKNIAISGKGIIDGAGKHWSWDWKKKQDPDKAMLRQMGNDTIAEEKRVFANGFLDLNRDGKDDGFGDNNMHYLRPSLIVFYECENVSIEGVTVKNSPFWTIHPVFCKNVTLRNLKVIGATINDDGIDPDSSEDVLIEGCDIKTHDDAISIKAGRDQDAWFRPGCKNIIIRNNTLQSGVNALCIGSEMSGGVSYVFAEHNIITNGKRALTFKCNLDRGGEVSNVYLRNTTITSCKEGMFVFRMDYHGYRGNNFPTKFHDFYVSGITCGEVKGKPFNMVGVEKEPISRVYISDVTIEKAGSESQITFANDIIFEHVIIDGKTFFNNQAIDK